MQSKTTIRAIVYNVMDSPSEKPVVVFMERILNNNYITVYKLPSKYELIIKLKSITILRYKRLFTAQMTHKLHE